MGWLLILGCVRFIVNKKKQPISTGAALCLFTCAMSICGSVPLGTMTLLRVQLISTRLLICLASAILLDTSVISICEGNLRAEIRTPRLRGVQRSLSERSLTTKAY